MYTQPVTRRVGVRVRRTVSFVQNACRYSLEVGEFHSRQPVAEFLFEKKRGYCEYFASAAALLLRLQGVPCRYVTGFNVQEGNRQGGHYVVREADAHAWIEAYLPDQEWMEADPTPEAEYQALRARLEAGWLADVTEWMAAEWAEISIRVRQGDWLAAFRWLWAQAKTFLRMIWNAKFTLLFLLGLVALVAVVRLAVRRRRRGDAAVSFQPGSVSEETAPDLAKLMSDLDTLWARRGLARPASRALLEHLEGMPSGKVSAEFLTASRKVVECFYRASFGGVRVPSAETEELRRSVERVKRL